MKLYAIQRSLCEDVSLLIWRIKTDQIKLNIDTLEKDELTIASMILQDFWIAPKILINSEFGDPEKAHIIDECCPKDK